MAEQRTTRAFSGGSYMRVERGITVMADHCRQLDVVDFTCFELKELFIKEWQRDALTMAYDLQEGGPLGQQNLYVQFTDTHVRPSVWLKPRIRFRFDWPGVREGFLVPAKWGWSREFPAKLLKEAPPELAAKFDKVTSDETRHAYEWGLVRWVFESLNVPEHCTTPAQMRYVWPALVPIVRAGGADELASSLSQPSSRAGDSASVPSWIAPYLKTTYDIVAKAVLLREVAREVPVEKGLTYKLHGPNFEISKGVSFAGYVPT